MKIEHNEGVIDRVVRIVLGSVILAVGAMYSSPWGLIGLLPFATGIFGYCGVYKVFGWSTVEKPSKKTNKKRVIKKKARSKRK